MIRVYRAVEEMNKRGMEMLQDYGRDKQTQVLYI